MTVSEGPRKIRLHFEGRVAENHTLPAQALVRALAQLQKVIFLLAKSHRGEPLLQRARVSHDMEHRFALVCGLPEEGGYAIPAVIGAGDPLPISSPDVEQVGDLFQVVTRAVGAGDGESLRKAIPESSYRNSIIRAYRETQPAKRSGLVFSIEDYSGQKMLDGFTASRGIALLEPRIDVEADSISPAWVTGALVTMDFEQRKLELKMEGGQALSATYVADYELTLLENPRRLVQVHGNVRRSADGAPVSLADVNDILEVDESEIKIVEIVSQQKTYVANPALIFHVKFDRDASLYDLIGPFGIEVSEITRPALEDALDETLTMLWEEYALEADANLTSRAMELKRELLSRFAQRAEDAPDV